MVHASLEKEIPSTHYTMATNKSTSSAKPGKWSVLMVSAALHVSEMVPVLPEEVPREVAAVLVCSDLLNNTQLALQRNFCQGVLQIPEKEGMGRVHFALKLAQESQTGNKELLTPCSTIK